MEETTECVYCNAEVPAMDEDEKPPAVTDHEAWADLAKHHAEDCEWIYTRAHRVMETMLDG